MIQHLPEGVFFHVVDDDALRFDAGVRFQDVDDQIGALELVFEVRGMNEDELVVLDGELDVFLEDEDFVSRVFV